MTIFCSRRRLSHAARLTAVLFAGWLAGCAIGPRVLETDRLRYNEAVKTTTEEQLLLNIVRLRYTDTPSSLTVSAIATQSEIQKSFSLIPFFAAVEGDPARRFSAILPQAQILSTDRPTITLTPLDDQEFTRKLFTPMSLQGVLYLAKTTWPISTVFRLWLENLNWVSNAQSGSGPTPAQPPDFARFLRGIDALQALQERGHVVFTTEEREETAGAPVAGARPSAGDLLAAAKENLEYRADPRNAGWTLVRKRRQPVLKVHPNAHVSADFVEFTRAFRLKPDVARYDLDVEALDPFPATYPPGGVEVLDLETRSLLQVLYFVAKGIEVPQEHVRQGFVRTTIDESGSEFDWGQVTRGLFRVRSTGAGKPPLSAHVAIKYLGYWFYIDRADPDTLSTFSLLVELSRLELGGPTGAGPALTLPLGGG